MSTEFGAYHKIKIEDLRNTTRPYRWSWQLYRLQDTHFGSMEWVNVGGGVADTRWGAKRAAKKDAKRLRRNAIEPRNHYFWLDS